MKYLTRVSQRRDAPACHCFETHIRDAIEINKDRSPLYSRLTDGASERFSKKFMRMPDHQVPHQNRKESQ